MGIDLRSTLEIFTNPHDLDIRIGQGDDGMLAFGIFRGPGHNFKPIVTSAPFSGKLEDTIESIKRILEAVSGAARKELANKESFASMLLNPDGAEIDESRVLNAELIGKIIEALRKDRIASTYAMSALQDQTKVSRKRSR